MMLLRDKPPAVRSQVFLILGALALAAGLLWYRFGPDLPFGDFLSGLLIGLSITFNLTGLWFFGRSRRENGSVES